MTENQERVLNQLTQKDVEYNQLLLLCTEVESAYLRILGSMDGHDREIIEKYISLCEELEYRRTCLACQFALGK